MKIYSRSSLRFLTIFNSFLCCAIIFWGSHDKISLYQTSETGAPVAKAKLLSGRELASDLANLSTAEPPAEPGPLTASYFAVALALLFVTKLGEAPIGATPLASPESSGFTNALHRRPPPHSGLWRA